MKNRFFTFGVMALLFAACSINEMDNTSPVTNDAEEFYATIEDASTRIFVDDDLKVLWHADDRVSIFNKYTYNQEYCFTGKTGANSGSFKKVPNGDFVTGNALDHVYAIYPYQESTDISNQGVLTIDLPATQSYAENSFGIGMNTMVSCSEGNELLFKNLCGYIMLKLYGENVTVSSISIKGNNDEPLAGKAIVSASVDDAPSMAFDASATKEISLTFDTPVTLGSTSETATTFWFVVPPTTFSKGITMTVRDDKNRPFRKSTTKSLVINRSTLSRMSALKCQIAEMDPPVIESFTFSPQTIDVSESAQDVKLSIHVTDESGVNDAHLPYAFIYLSSNYDMTRQLKHVKLESGTAKDGVYSVTFTVPQGKQAGEWTVSCMPFYDLYDNPSHNSEKKPTCDKKTLTVINNSATDTKGPVIESFTFSPQTIDVSESAQDVKLSIHVTDESGVNDTNLPYAFIYLSSNYDMTRQLKHVKLESGTAKDGVYSVTFTVPQGKQAGEWTVSCMPFYDLYDNPSHNSEKKPTCDKKTLTVINN